MFVDRRGHRDDEKIRRAQLVRVGGPAGLCRAQLFGGHLAGTVDARGDIGDARGIDIEADDACARARKTHRHRQADIAEADDGNLTRMRHGGFLR